MAKAYSLFDVLQIKRYEQTHGDIEKQIKEPIALVEHIDDDRFNEGDLKEVILSIHERNPVARKKCIEHYGAQCFICKMQFEERYGSIFADRFMFIIEHHCNFKMKNMKLIQF